MATELMSVSVDQLAALHGRLTKAQQELIETVTDKLDDYGAALVGAIQDEVPVREGKLRKSARYRVKNADEKTVELVVSIGGKDRPDVVVRTILYGSLAHEIVPKKKNGVLRFLVGNEVRFAKRVNHPGTKPDDFFKRALNATDSERKSIIAEIGRLTVEMIEG